MIRERPGLPRGALHEPRREGVPGLRVIRERRAYHEGCPLSLIAKACRLRMIRERRAYHEERSMSFAATSSESPASATARQAADRSRRATVSR